MNNLPIKNRTSTVPPERTAARIEEMLAKAGASDVRKRYENQELRGIDFIIPTEQGEMSFRMPVDTEAAYQVLYNDRRARRLSTTLAQQKALREQAKRTAWKLAQEWLEIQLAMVAMQQAEIVQVLLPYAVRGDQTFFQAFKRAGYAGLLAAPKDKGHDAGNVIDAG
jgi:hypothetical protein